MAISEKLWWLCICDSRHPICSTLWQWYIVHFITENIILYIYIYVIKPYFRNTCFRGMTLALDVGLAMFETNEILIWLNKTMGEKTAYRMLPYAAQHWPGQRSDCWKKKSIIIMLIMRIGLAILDGDCVDAVDFPPCRKANVFIFFSHIRIIGITGIAHTHTFSMDPFVHELALPHTVYITF